MKSYIMRAKTSETAAIPHVPSGAMSLEGSIFIEGCRSIIGTAHRLRAPACSACVVVSILDWLVGLLIRWPSSVFIFHFVY
jgi:hypothetical protein